MSQLTGVWIIPSVELMELIFKVQGARKSGRRVPWLAERTNGSIRGNLTDPTT